MIDYMVENFELIMGIIAGIWGFELCVFIYCLLQGRHKRRKKRKVYDEFKEQRQKKDSDKKPEAELDIIDLDDDDFTFDFI